VETFADVISSQPSAEQLVDLGVQIGRHEFVNGNITFSGLAFKKSKIETVSASTVVKHCSQKRNFICRNPSSYVIYHPHISKPVQTREGMLSTSRSAADDRV
jgi:hypothetical protein